MSLLFIASCRRTSTSPAHDASLPRPVSLPLATMPPDAGPEPEASVFVDEILAKPAVLAEGTDPHLCLDPDDPKIQWCSDPRALREVLSKALGSHPDLFAVPEGRKARLTARLALGKDPRKKQTLAALELELRWQDVRSRPGDNPFIVARILASSRKLDLRRAVRDAVARLCALETVRRGDTAQVIAGLSSPDDDVRQVAFAAVEDRRLGAAVPRLIELLQDKALRDRAIGALVVLRDERAVRPLADLARFKDLELMLRVVDAIAAIGGDEAHAYLEFVASGHEVPGIRELARQALERLRRREPTP